LLRFLLSLDLCLSIDAEDHHIPNCSRRGLATVLDILFRWKWCWVINGLVVETNRKTVERRLGEGKEGY